MSTVADYAAAQARATAWISAMHSARENIGPAPRNASPLSDLRERYARGKISLGTFEAEVELLLRRQTA